MDEKMENSTKRKTLREGLTSMLCFQMALCLAAAGVFFAAVRLGGENEDAARNAARMLCREEQEILFDTEKLGQLWQQFCGFWQGGAGHILEEIRDFVAKQIVSPEQLPEPVVGMSEQTESGAGGAFPDKGMAAAKGTTLAPYLLSAQLCTPVAGRVTSCFGWREHPISRQAEFSQGEWTLRRRRGHRCGRLCPGWWNRSATTKVTATIWSSVTPSAADHLQPLQRDFGGRGRAAFPWGPHRAGGEYGHLHRSASAL